MGVNSSLKKLCIKKEKRVFLSVNVRRKGVFSKLESVDMSSSIVMSEGAGARDGSRWICEVSMIPTSW